MDLVGVLSDLAGDAVICALSVELLHGSIVAENKVVWEEPALRFRSWREVRGASTLRHLEREIGRRI
ncbi:hypothetical protein EV2_044358 [Malus domestica]